MFQRGFKRGSREFQVCLLKFYGPFKSVSEVFLFRLFKAVLFWTVCFKEVTRFSMKVLNMFQDNFNGVSRVFQGLFKEDSKVFQASFKRFEERVNVVSRGSLVF